MAAVISVYRRHAPKSPHSRPKDDFDLIWSVDYFTTGHLFLSYIFGFDCLITDFVMKYKVKLKK